MKIVYIAIVWTFLFTLLFAYSSVYGQKKLKILRFSSEMKEVEPIGKPILYDTYYLDALNFNGDNKLIIKNNQEHLVFPTDSLWGLIDENNDTFYFYDNRFIYKKLAGKVGHFSIFEREIGIYIPFGGVVSWKNYIFSENGGKHFYKLNKKNLRNKLPNNELIEQIEKRNLSKNDLLVKDDKTDQILLIELYEKHCSNKSY